MTTSNRTNKKDGQDIKKKQKECNRQPKRYFEENLEGDNNAINNKSVCNNLNNVLYRSHDDNDAVDNVVTGDILTKMYNLTNDSSDSLFSDLSYYNHLFKTVFLNHTYFNHYDISYPSDNLKNDLNYYRNTVKKTMPFKRIYNSLISQYISEAQLFFDENSFVEVGTRKVKGNYEHSVIGAVNSYKNIKITDVKKSKAIEYPNSLISNKNTIFITDQIYNKLRSKNFVTNFTVKELSHLKITKFTDIKVKKLNYKEAVELYAYEQVSQNIKGSECKIYETETQKIVIVCNSSFQHYNKTKRIYSTPDDAKNVEFVLMDDVIKPVDILGKKKNYLDWLNGIDLVEGEYSSVGGKIYRIESEGFVFSAEGFVIEEVNELY